MAVQERAVATRERIVRSAAAVFAETGFEGATINMVLARCGVTKGALYFHFSSKRELADAVMAAQQDWLRDRPIDVEAPLQQLVDLSYEFCRALQHDPLVQAAIRLTVERATLTDDPARRELYGVWQTHARAAFEQAGRKGQLAPAWRPADAAKLVVACVTGLQLTSAAESDRRDLAGRIHVFWRAVVPTITTPETAELLRISPPRRR